MARSALLLVITLLAFSYLVPFNAVATSRNLGLSYERREILAVKDDINLQAAPAEIKELDHEEIGVEFQSNINDYPGSGANNHHTPRPPATLEGGKS